MLHSTGRWRKWIFQLLFASVVVLFLPFACFAQSNRPARWCRTIGTNAGPMRLAGRRLFVNTNRRQRQDSADGGQMLCIDSTTGALLWSMEHEKLDRPGMDLQFIGIQSRPVVDGGRVYYVSNRGELVCLGIEGRNDEGSLEADSNRDHVALNDPDLLWSLDMVTDLDVFKVDAGDICNPISSPLVMGDNVYCVTGNGSTYANRAGADTEEFVPKPDAPSFLAVDKYTGRIVWSSAAPGKEIMYGQWSSPVAFNFQGRSIVIFPGGDGRLYGFDAATGVLLWKLDCNEGGARWWTQSSAGTRCFFVATPTVLGESVFVGLNQDLETAVPVSKPLLCIDLASLCQTGTNGLTWKFSNAEYLGTFSSAVGADGLIYTYCESSGTLFALDRFAGELIWHSQDLGDPAGCFASPVLWDNCLYVTTALAIHVFSVGRETVLKGRLEFDRQINGSPVFSEERMYVATVGRLLAIDWGREVRRSFSGTIAIKAGEGN